MDPAALDLALAIAHHLAAFAVVGLIAAEAALLWRPAGALPVARLALIDAAYGLAALLVVIAGASRVAWGLKGAAYYLGNPVFWAKMAAFTAVGLLSIGPTVLVLRLRAAERRGAPAVPSPGALRLARRLVAAELALLALLPALAAAMARGYGL